LYELFLADVSRKFSVVLVVAGNHEYYGGDIATVDKLISSITQKLPNVHYLQRSCFDFGDVTFLGATLWTHIPETSMDYYRACINDFHQISTVDQQGKRYRLHPYDTNKLHKLDENWLRTTIQEYPPSKKICVLTHHCPISTNCQTKPMRKGGSGYGITKLDYDDMTHLMGGRVVAWAFGHTHHSSSQIFNGTKIVSNCLGYIKQGERDENFSPGFTVEISHNYDQSFYSRGHYVIPNNEDTETGDGSVFWLENVGFPGGDCEEKDCYDFSQAKTLAAQWCKSSDHVGEWQKSRNKFWCKKFSNKPVTQVSSDKIAFLCGNNIS